MAGEPSRVIVLGHTGFVGRHLLRLLARRFPSVPAVGFSSAEIDLSDRASLEPLSRRLDRDCVLVHCAAIQKWVRDDLDAFEANLRMVVNVLHLLAQTPIRQLVYFSSAAVYGEGVTNLDITEQTPHAPTSYYGIAKSACEGLLGRQATGSTAVTVLRPSLIYGEDTPEAYYLPAGFAARALKGETIEVWGNGEELRDYIHVEDACELVARIIQAKIAGTFNLASGRTNSYTEVLHMVAAALGQEISQRNRPRTRVMVSLAMRNERLLSACGGYDFVPLAEGVRRIVEAKRVEKKRAQK